MTNLKEYISNTKWVNKLLFVLFPFTGALIFLILVFFLRQFRTHELVIILTYMVIGAFTTILYYHFENKAKLFKTLILIIIYYYICSGEDYLLYPKSMLPMTLENIITPRLVRSVNFFTTELGIVLFISLFFTEKFKNKLR
ncbi:hypothetical protein SAMN05216474_0430 [Lishizhenia tianjinensis]|uniref:Uncharacterized protein n=1 Tax=Lishizhenia tianjinensis TaxID=477690 RepID=A0A1I6XSI2_9FLAO|nr:hypothetical protein SAMN05216474_0430 [Lishizhenia tianjinensis]